jgi:hypothetical protein
MRRYCDWADERDQFHARSVRLIADSVRMGVCKARETVKTTENGIQGKDSEPLWLGPFDLAQGRP